MKNIVKELFVYTMSVCIVLSIVSIKCMAESRFSDMSGHWAEKYVDILAERSIISGMPDGLFYPDLPVTTGQFVTMLLVERFGKIEPTDEYWASGYLDYAYSIGIVEQNDIITAEEPIERRHAARIGHELLIKVMREDDVEDWSMAENLADLYSCKSCVIHIAQFYVKGIMLGRPDGFFHGYDGLTRAEAAIIITKMFEPEFRNPQTTSKNLSEISSEGTITAEEVKNIMESNESALLIDVRSEEEYNAEHIPGSYRVELSELTDKLSETIIPANKDTVIILYCQKGSRSTKAFNILKEAGYQNIYNLGSIENWYSSDGSFVF